MKSICLLAASRGRPTLWKQSIDAALSLADHSHKIFVALQIDDDEPNKDQYQESLRATDQLIIGATAPTSIASIPQALYELFANHEIYGFLNDDMVCRTKGWDSMLRNRMEPVSLIRVSDGMDFCGTTFFWSRQWIETLGFILPQNFACCEDIYLQEIGELLATRGYADNYQFARDILFEHIHCDFNKREKDATDQLNQQRRLVNGRENRDAYNKAREAIPLLVRKLIEAINQ